MREEQDFKFRFDSHFGYRLDIETEYFMFRCTVSGCIGYIYIYIYIYIKFLISSIL